MFECSTTNGTTVSVMVRDLISMTSVIAKGEKVRPVQSVVILCYTISLAVIGSTNVNFDEKIMLFILRVVRKARYEPQTIAGDIWYSKLSIWICRFT